MSKAKNNFVWFSQLCLFVVALLFLPFDNHLLIPMANAQENCETALKDAQKQYDEGHLPEAIALLNRCLPESLPSNDRVDAYRLLALAHIKQDSSEQAEAAVRNMLTLNRKYEINELNDPPVFQEMVKKIRPTIPAPMREKLFGGIKKWFWIGGGIAGTAVAVATINKKTVEPDLPVPPDLP